TEARDLRETATPVHRSPAVGRPGAGPWCQAQSHHPFRRRTQPDESSARLPVQHALPVRRAALPRRRAAAARTRTRSLRCLSLPAPMNTPADSLEPVADVRAVVNPNAAAPAEAYGDRRSQVMNEVEFSAALAEISSWPDYARTPLTSLPSLAS